MRPLALSSAEINTMVYPTELEERVRDLLFALAGGEGDLKLKEEKFTSHYGYSFKILTVKLGKEAAESLLKRAICFLEELDFLSLMNTLESHVDGRDLYIRLDKQGLALGRYELFSRGLGGYVRIKLTFRKKVNDLKSLLREVREGRCPAT
ncbi:MAG: RNA-binding domain-containing protein [Candidatus Korarchaeota archaeon]|nr:RNA-binding domain-containing protein [Candidatus Korarchaeota archaeon]